MICCGSLRRLIHWGICPQISDLLTLSTEHGSLSCFRTVPIKSYQLRRNHVTHWEWFIFAQIVACIKGKKEIYTCMKMKKSIYGKKKIIFKLKSPGLWMMLTFFCGFPLSSLWPGKGGDQVKFSVPSVLRPHPNSVCLPAWNTSSSNRII